MTETTSRSFFVIFYIVNPHGTPVYSVTFQLESIVPLRHTRELLHLSTLTTVVRSRQKIMENCQLPDSRVILLNAMTLFLPKYTLGKICGDS